MSNPFTFSDQRPSPLSSLLKRSFNQARRRQNFVRPSTQELDIRFHCPCCANRLTVPASQAGKKGRCRHCYSPIKIAAPRINKAATDLSNDIDPLRNPRDYPLCGHRAKFMDYIPRGAVAALPLLALIGIGVALLSQLPSGDPRLGALAAIDGPTPFQLLTSPAEGAEQLVTTFLSSSDWTHSIAHVHDGLTFSNEIEALTEKLPNGNFQTSSKLNDDGTSTVRVNFSDGSLTHFQVVNIAGEDLILWDANPTGLPNDDFSRLVGLPEMEPK